VAELQLLDDEVKAIREIRNGKKLQDIEVVPAAREAIREYLSQDQGGSTIWRCAMTNPCGSCLCR